MNKEQKAVCQEISQYARFLKLSVLRGNIATVIEDAVIKEPGYDQFLLSVLRQEYDRQQENGRRNRIRAAGFPCERHLEDLIVQALPPDARQKLPLLRSLEFIQSGRNVILAGNPGTGKTHLATALGI